MVFKKIKKGEDMIWEIKGFAPDLKVIERWKVMNEDFPQVIKILSQKYSFRIYVKGKEEKDLDLKWIR